MRFDAFSLSDLQNAIVLLGAAESEGLVDIRFLRQRLYDHIAREKGQARIRRRITPAVLCAVCGHLADRQAVNVSRCTNVGGGYTSVLVCVNPSCMHVEYIRG